MASLLFKKFSFKRNNLENHIIVKEIFFAHYELAKEGICNLLKQCPEHCSISPSSLYHLCIEFIVKIKFAVSYFFVTIVNELLNVNFYKKE